MPAKNVLKKIKPGRKEEQEIQRIAKRIIRSLKIKKTKVMLGGSLAKGTWLKGNHDIDIYVKFDQEFYAGMDISKILQDHFPKGRVVHGSRDYIQVEQKEYTIELIPIMDIRKVEDADNITDISPFHTKWVMKHKKYRNDIRLAKAFAKANHLYGAESFIKGFSGYAIEVLTIHYKGFNNLLKNATKWHAREVIDTMRYHKGNVTLNEAKMHSPLILVDPVQATRNVTAVLSREKYDLFIKKAKEYRARPSEQFFVKEPFSLENIMQKKKGKLISLRVKPLEGKRDVVGAKLLKSFEFLKKELEAHDFLVKDAGWHWDDIALLWFIIDQKPLSPKVKHDGPPLREKERLEHFKEKWKEHDVHVGKNGSYVILDRKYKKPEELISDVVTNDFVASRVVQVLEQNVYE